MNHVPPQDREAEAAANEHVNYKCVAGPFGKKEIFLAGVSWQKSRELPTNSQTEEEMAHNYALDRARSVDGDTDPQGKPFLQRKLAALWGLRKGAEAEREKWEKIFQKAGIDPSNYHDE